jgi:hypothetical protein
MIYGSDVGNTVLYNIVFHIVMLNGKMLHKGDMLETPWNESDCLTCIFQMVTIAT